MKSKSLFAVCAALSVRAGPAASADKRRIILGAVVGMIIGIVPAQADSLPFPVVSVGDPFEGTLSINLATPLDPLALPNHYNYPLGSNFYPSLPAGTITVTLGGVTFSQMFTYIVVPLGYGDYSWSTDSTPPYDVVTVDGIPSAAGFGGSV